MKNDNVKALVYLVAACPDLAKRLKAVRGLQGRRTEIFAKPFLNSLVEKALVDCGAIGRRERDNTHVVHITDRELDQVLHAAGEDLAAPGAAPPADVTVAKVDPTILQEVVVGKNPMRHSKQAVEPMKDDEVRARIEPAKVVEMPTPGPPTPIVLTVEEELVLERFKGLSAFIADLYPRMQGGRQLVPSLQTALAKQLIAAGGMPGESACNDTGCRLPFLRSATDAVRFAMDLDRALQNAQTAYNMVVNNAKPPPCRKTNQRYQQALTLIKQNLAGAEPVAAK